VVINLARSRHGGPPREVAESREGLKRSSLVGIVSGGNSVVIVGGSRGVVSIVEYVFRGLCEHAGGTLDMIRGDIESLMVGRAFVG